ncbi:MAG TPA: NifB/NifX family molybdenum-iron cluster-binding protein [Candidatus Hydrogenedentes bacterium]|nr:NifB/NifX family molybdenum-iron cluster-binding protein [Candidatus Hydrogenedentota bacterium]
MKAAIPDWQGRVSPVFDVAAQLVVVDVEDGQVRERRMVAMTADGLQARAEHVAELGVNVLICGAISWPLELALSNAGVEVVPQTCGEVEDVLAAFVAGRLGHDAFLMPGCCGRRRRFRKQCRRGRSP